MKNRLVPLIVALTQETVLEKWFSPLQKALDKVRYPEKVFGTLSIPAFLLLGCLRQLQSHKSLREQIQSLAHLSHAITSPWPVQPSQMRWHRRNDATLFATAFHI